MNRTAVTLSLLAALTLSSPAAAASNTIGATDGSFESGLVGVTTTGDVRSVTHFGTALPSDGGRGVALTTEPSSGTTAADADSSTLSIENFSIPALATTLRLEYDVFTDEAPASPSNDTFTAKLVLVTAGGENILLASDTFDTFFDAHWTDYASHTGQRTLTANVAAHAGSADTFTLELRVEDKGDGRGNTAVFIDNVRFVEGGDPIAALGFSFKEAAINETIRFDGSASTDDGAITSYDWNFGNGWIGNGPIIDFPYDAGGFYNGTLTVTDDDGKTDTTQFQVLIGGEINRAPVFVSVPPTNARENNVYVYDVDAQDPESAFGDTVTYALDTAPAGMAIDPATGVINWIPDSSAPAVSSVVVSATDSMGLVTTQSFDITVDTSVFIIAVRDDGYIRYARSNGDGTWSGQRWIDRVPNGTVRGVTINDFDNDGDMDFAVAGEPGNVEVYLYLNDGFDNFTNAGVVVTVDFDGNPSYGMTSGDFNEDGNQDIRINLATDRYVLAFGAGDGTFPTKSEIDDNLSAKRETDVADFNLDGHLDIVSGRYNTGYLEVLLGVGDGTFTSLGEPLDPGTDPYAVMAGDFNEDGFPDIIANYGSNGDHYLYPGNGDGTFGAGVYLPNVDNNNHAGGDAYDFNRDGHLDIIQVTYTTDTLRYIPGNGDGTFGAAVVIDNIGNTSLSVAAPPIGVPTGTPLARVLPNPGIVAGGGTLGFTAAGSSDDGSIVSYDWTFSDDASTATGETASHTYPTEEGKHSAKVLVTDNDGRKATAVARVFVQNDPPVADAGGPYTFGEINSTAGVYTVTLDGTGSHDTDAAALTYEWDLGNFLDEDFSDGTIDPLLWDQVGATAVIGTEGTEAQLIGNGSWGARHIVTHKTYPRVHGDSFTGVVYDATTSGGHYMMWGLRYPSTDYSYTRFTYAIYFNGGTIYIYERGGSRGQVSTYSYNTAYEVRIDVKKQGAIYYMRQVGAPNWTILYQSNQYTDTDLQLGATIANGDFRFRSFTAPSDRSTDPSPTVVYPRKGTYDVSLKVTDAGGQSDVETTQVNLVVGPPPVSDPGGPYVLTENDASCNTWTVTFDGTGSTDEGGILSYDWDFGDGNTGTGATPTHTYAAPGTYTVSLTVMDNAFQTHTMSTTVETTAQALPVAAAGGPASVDESVANGGLWSVTFNTTGSSDDVGICDYTWDFGDGQTGTGAAPTHQYAGTGTYTATVTVRDHAHQEAMATHTVVVENNDPPVAVHNGPYAVDEAAANEGLWTVNFSAAGSSDDFGIYDYSWNFGDGNLGSGANPTHQYDSVGVYNVVLTVRDHALQSHQVSTTAVVTANDMPVPNIVATSVADETFAFGGRWTVPFDATGSTDDFGIWTYDWDFDDGLTGTGDTISHDYFVLGDYNVQLTVTDHGEQAVPLIHPLSITANDPPVADAGDVLVLNESHAIDGVWHGQFNGSGSTDDVGIFDYEWWIDALQMNEPFNGTTIDAGAWITSGATQDGKIMVTGANSWTNRYVTSVQNFTRSDDLVFQARVTTSTSTAAQAMMIGFKDTSTNYSYTAMPHAIYFENGNIDVYEFNSQRANNIGSYVRGETYDVRIRLQRHGGAGYYIKQADSNVWTTLHYANNNDTTGTLKAHFTANDNTWVVDDIRVGYIGSGVNYVHRFHSTGTHNVTLNVRDHALQVDQDTTTVQVTAGDPPTADPGGPYTIEQGMILTLNSTGSSDDFGIARYDWDFGDGSKSRSANPKKFWRTPGTYTVTLTVTDNIKQTHTASTTVEVITGAAPVADAGGPYQSGAGGPSVMLDGGGSSDDYGIANYLWDLNTASDSDGDGNPSNDVDAVGRQVLYTYSATGTYTVQLTVVDGVGQTDTDTATVNVVADLPPRVVTVPWVSTDIAVPHETWPGKEITFKGVAHDADLKEYEWDFGDGETSGKIAASSANWFALEAKHAYPDTVPAGTPFVARLTVWDNAGNSSTDTYNVIVKAKSLTVEVNVAIDEALWWMHKAQDRAGSDAGQWDNRSEVATTASSTNAFEANGHQPEGDPSEDPYVTTVRDGLDYMFTTLSTESIPVQTSGDPDINGNGYGIRVNEGSYPYQGGMVIDMIIGSGTPLRYVRTSHNSYQVIRGQRYADIVQDMAESYIYGQQDSGSTLGGWRYGWNGGNDNSAAQWAAIGLIPAERIFGAQIPSWVYTNNLTILANTQDQRYGQLGYTGTAGTWGDASTTASGMVMMAMDDFDREDGRWIKAANRLRQHWDTPSGNDSLRNNYYAMFATSKAMRLANPSRIEQMCLGCAETSIDWYGDETVGLARSIMDQQLADGHWVHPSGLSGTGYWQYGLTTAWATLILTRELFEVAPVADAGRDRVWGISRVGDPRPLTLVGSGSFHPDPFRTIVLYEWDVDGDGLFDTSSTDPNTVTEYLEADYPVPTLPRSITVTLRVTDDAGKTDTDTAVILLAEPPHPPIADAGPPGTPPGTGYTCTLGIPCVLDASDSFEIDPTDFIARWEWELDGVGIPDFDEATGEVISYTFNTEGTFNIGVRVWDDGRFNDLNGDDVVDENERLSDQEFTTVDVEPNLPPVAVAADMTVEEGQTFNHDGSGSSDPNGDPLTYAWDLDNDGNYDNATGVAPSQVFPADGVYTVGLQVSDSLLTDETTATITVTDRGPTAAFDWAPEPQEEGTAVSFGDLSTSSPDTIVAWAWDFDGLGASSDQHPSFTFDDDGTYTVTLTVTDSDGSVDSVSHDVTITDRAPTAAFTWAPEPSVEGSPVAFTDTSTSSPDAIVSWAWDFAGLGSSAAQNPSFAFPDNGVYTVSLTVTDDDGSTNTTTHDVTVLNANPVVNAGLDQTTGEGSTVSLDPATFTDAGTADTHTATVDWGDGSGPQAATVNQGAGSGSVPGSHVYTDGGVYTVTVTVTDDDGGVGSDTMIVTVGNAGAQVDAGPDQTINEGETASLAPATFTYIGLTDTHTATINWGDGMTSAGTVSEAGGSGSVSGSHTYVDDGVYTVTVTVTDDDGGVGSDSLTVTVLNLPPVVEAGPDQSTSENTTISLAPATFTDAGTADTHTATVDWGDGSGPQPAAVTQGSGSGTVASSHAYTTGGTYTVTVTVTDDDGGVGIDTLTVNVDGGNPPEQTIFDLIARAKPEKIDLVWAPVNGADAYNVYRSTTAGGPYALIAAGHTCTYCAFADSGLTNGVTYFYVVTSITGGQESLSSNEASATPQVTTRRRR